MLIYFRSERVLYVWDVVYRVMGRKSIVGKINVVFGHISCIVVLLCVRAYMRVCRLLLELLYIILFLDLLVCCNGGRLECKEVLIWCVKCEQVFRKWGYCVKFVLKWGKCLVV